MALKPIGVARTRWQKDLVKWHFAVQARDRWECQPCKVLFGVRRVASRHGGHLEEQGSRPDLRLELGNGAATCEACNAGQAKKGDPARWHDAGSRPLVDILSPDGESTWVQRLAKGPRAYTRVVSDTQIIRDWRPEL